MAASDVQCIAIHDHPSFIAWILSCLESKFISARRSSLQMRSLV